MPFFATARQLGARVSDVLEDFGLDEGAVQDPEKMLHAETVYACLNSLAVSANTLHLGFHVGDKIGFDEWPPFREAMKTARSLGEALNLMIAKVPRESSSVAYRLILNGRDAVFDVTRFVRAKNSPRQTEGFGAAYYVRMIRAACGTSWNPSEVVIRTRFPEVIPSSPYGVRVERKRSGAFELRFPAEWLFDTTSFRGKSFPSQRAQIPPAAADEVSLVSALWAAARPMLTRLDLNPGDIAAELGIAPRQLAIELRTSGTTLAKELRRLRADEAKSALAGTEPISSISQRLGYSDPAHFARFFRSQTGTSPRDYRKSLADNG